MTRLVAVAVAVVVSLSSVAAAQSAGSLVKPTGSWVLDRTGELGAGTVAQIDAVARSIRGAGHGELYVVLIKSTGGRDPRSYGTELFNRWGIGSGQRHDGVLLLAAIGDRKAEIILGQGVDSGEDVARSDAVMRDAVIANFKRRDVNAAMLQGARGLQALLARSRLNGAGAQTAAPQVPKAERFALARPRGAWVIDVDDHLSPALEAALNQLSWDEESAGRRPLLFVAYDGIARHTTPHEVGNWVREDVLRAGERVVTVVLSPPSRQARVVGIEPAQSEAQVRDLERLHQELQRGLWEGLRPADEAAAERTPLYLAAERTREYARTGSYPWTVGEQVSQATAKHGGKMGFGFAGLLLAGGAWLRKYLRYRPRSCEACGTPRQLLDEHFDDPHLTAGQQREEALASVDYDVWWCGRCRNALTLRHRALFTAYASCPKCDYVTKSQQTTTLVSATYDHGGVVRVVETCQHCNYHREYDRHTPRLTRSSSSSSSSRSSFGSSSGGGRSSGRGSSGSW